MAERQIAYLWAPYFGTAVARSVAPQLADRPLVLIDEHGRVLAGDAAAARVGVVPGLSDHQAAAHCPGALLTPAARFPIWEAQERFLDRISPTPTAGSRTAWGGSTWTPRPPRRATRRASKASY